MQKITKIAISATLVAVFVVALALGVTMLFFAAWLHTYSALTREIPVAEVIMHPIAEDEQGEYIEVEVTPKSSQSALSHLIAPDNQDQTIELTQTYKLYGDTVSIGGPIVKFHSGLVLLNFETIYKFARIRGAYNADIEAERNRTTFSTIDLNGGFDQTWWTLNNNEDKWPYSMFVDRVQFSVPGEPGFRGGGELKRYQIVVTNDGFAWDLLERIPTN